MKTIDNADLSTVTGGLTWKELAECVAGTKPPNNWTAGSVAENLVCSRNVSPVVMSVF